MAVTLYDEGTMFVPIRSGEICPICGHRDGRCSKFYYKGELLYIACKHETSLHPMVNLPGWYKHYVNDRNIRPSTGITTIKAPQPQSVKRHITKEILALRSSVYKDFKALICNHIEGGLYEEDKEDLLRRGLAEEEIRRLGVFSVPKSTHKIYGSGLTKIKLSNFIINELFKKYREELLNVPGFMNCKNKYGGEFITYKSKMKNPETGKLEDIRGYFIPYYNIDGLLVGMQYRLSIPIKDEKGKLIRYFWLSSKNASSGSPIDYYVPTYVKRDDILLVGEGALKMKIAAEKLGYRAMAEAGVSNYRNLVKNILLLEKKEGRKLNIILALDMDKYTNFTEVNGKKFFQIIEAEKKTLQLLKKTGHKVVTAEWDINKGKGIDDALQNSAKITFKISH